ncbi:MAG: hypothetical protein M1837_001256 [Sclerophora amabilis]|nr:MAG: hypothetical protein M1837_001256 [Sclerophora amabilis]
MSFRLPAQEPEDGTYMGTSRTINWAIRNRLLPGYPEGETGRVWNAILSKYFPDREGYATGPDMAKVTGRLALLTSHIVDITADRDYGLLVVECKAPGFETEDGVWREAVAQVESFLRRFAASHQRRVFGAISVGKAVKFYEWDRTSEQVRNVAGDNAMFYLDLHCQTVSDWLIYFRENHR